MHAQDPAQVVCVPPRQTGASRNFLLTAAPSPNKYKTKRRLVLNNDTSLRAPSSSSSSAPRRARSTSNLANRSIHNATLNSFINWVDSPPSSSTTAYSLVPSPASLAAPSPHENPKRQGRTFEFVPFSFPSTSSGSPRVQQLQAEPPRNSSETTLVSPRSSHPPTAAPVELYSFLDHSPPPTLSAFATKIKNRVRSATTTSIPKSKTSFCLVNTSTTELDAKPKTPPRKNSNPFKNIMSSHRQQQHHHLQLTSTSSSSSEHSSSSNTTLTDPSYPTHKSSKSRKAPEKLLPFTTDQIAQMDMLLGNVRAGKGKAPSAPAPPASTNPEDKVWKLPYVPLNGSAPSGTRSLGRDGEYYPPPTCVAQGTTGREVGRGNALPFKDERGVLWSGQDEIDEYAHLLPEERERRRRAKKVDTNTANGWTHFPPPSAGGESVCSLDSDGKSPLRHGSNASSFEVGYDEPVLIAEQERRTVGQIMNAPPVMMSTTRGGDAFPMPTTPPAPPGLSSTSSRPRGGDRRKVANTTPPLATAGAVQKNYAIDQAGRMEYFSDAFAPVSPTSVLPPSPMTGPPPVNSRSKLHRHSTSLAVGFASFAASKQRTDPPSQQPQYTATQVQYQAPMQPKAPGYLKPLATAAGQVYNGIRQASFSSGTPSTPPPMPAPRDGSRPPTTGSKAVKEKGSGLNLGGMFKKFGSTKA
ncbi:hypothetical protein FRB97_007871 [Tulasnella sp. 331]|nr:hypothetical protein FRB97_007871 [Tulasnella sp. 331]KAG8877517.1 hypothetical protein FRB98_006672 [Tulasnella sp. 332]